MGRRKLGEGRNSVVTSIRLTEGVRGKRLKGKKGRGSKPRTKAWSRVGDGDNNDVVFGERRHRRPGFGRLYID